jgi:hypothetical protein
MQRKQVCFLVSIFKFKQINGFANTRFWSGYSCFRKRTIHEKCFSDNACLNSELLICIDGICKIKKNKRL